MDLTTEQYERISRFLDADMTLSEMDMFEEELTANPAMRQQLDFEQSVRDGFTLKKMEDALPNEIILNGKTGSKRNGTVIAFYKRRWFAIAVAASVLVAVVSITLVINKKTDKPSIVQDSKATGIKKKDTAQTVMVKAGIDSSKRLNFKELYKHYFVKDTLPETYPMLLAEALTNYENGDYSSLQKLNLTSMSETRGMDEMNNKQKILELGHYYKGIAFLETNNAEQAIRNLQWVVQHSTNKLLKHKAEWYLALAFIKKGNKVKAIDELKKLMNNTNNLYAEKAKNLMTVLK